MHYIIVTNLLSKHPLIETDTQGKALVFTTYPKAKAYAEKYAIEQPSILAVCSDQKNYLV
jgi:hypothetical protein